MSSSPSSHNERNDTPEHVAAVAAMAAKHGCDWPGHPCGRDIPEFNGRDAECTCESLVTGLCANCGERPGTETWGDVLAVMHGWTQKWCEVCVLEKQVEHDRERAAELPELERRLEEVRRG